MPEILEWLDRRSNVLAEVRDDLRSDQQTRLRDLAAKLKTEVNESSLRVALEQVRDAGLERLWPSPRRRETKPERIRRAHGEPPGTNASYCGERMNFARITAWQRGENRIRTETARQFEFVKSQGAADSEEKCFRPG
jgi:hypothetical protein